MNNTISYIVLMIVPVLFSLSVHEACHGYAAYALGDPTAKLQGRLTLNPLKHIDVFGLAVLFITRMIGWAKPVPVDPRYFKNPRKDMLWVALAGPASNLALGLIFALLLNYVGPLMTGSIFNPVKIMMEIMVFINVGLAIFNLIPIPPLDGGRVMVGLLPENMANSWARIEPYGFIILLVLVFTKAVNFVIFPIIHNIVNIFLSI
ncbi:MAG TPA: site-2 protease family protein [Desulfomonilia bacterium]|jgi:Zn-dependent protease